MRKRPKQQAEQPAATPIEEPSQPQKGNSMAEGGKQLLALIPILLCLAVYIFPTVVDMYEAYYGSVS